LAKLWDDENTLFGLSASADGGLKLERSGSVRSEAEFGPQALAQPTIPPSPPNFKFAMYYGPR
jgi:hypothetical protein